MTNPPRGICRRSAASAALLLMVLTLLALLAAIGCDDDRHVTFPESASGTIVGTLSDGAPYDLEDIWVRVASVGNDPRFNVEAAVDSTGRFVVTVPNGGVTVMIGGGCIPRTFYYGLQGPTADPTPADTLHVDGDIRHIDFRLGRVTADIDAASILQFERFKFGLLDLDENLDYVGGCRFDAEPDIHAEMRMVIPGRYRLGLRHESLGRVYLPATFDSTEADVVTVVAGQTTHHESSLPSPARISGHITGSWQALGMSSPRVEVWIGERTVADSRADDDGAFDISLLLGGEARLVTWIDNVPGYFGGPDFESATVFDLRPGGHIAGVERVESALSIDLHGLSLAEPSYRVRLYDADGRDLTRRPNGNSGLSGQGPSFRCSNLLPGTVYLSLTPTNGFALWSSQFYDGGRTLAEADPILIPSGGGIAQIEMTVHEGGRISGRILNDSQEIGWSSIYFEVYLADSPDEAVISRINYWDIPYSFSTGAFVINQLHDGAYKFRARIGNHDWRYWPDADNFSDAGIITITDHGEVTGIDLTLP